MRETFGIVNAASPTPITPDGGFDAASARRLCRRWMDIGLDGAFVLGTMGEGPLLSDAVRNAWLETALAEAGERVTIFAGTFDSSRARMRERALRYARMGAHCVVLCATPNTSPARAVEDVLAVADACPAPCAYYEAPFLSGTALALEEILRILAHPNIRALKDSSYNTGLSQGITAPEFRPEGVFLMDGAEYHTVFSALVGYDGVLHGGGVLTGRRVREVWQAVRAGDIPRAVALDREKSNFLSTVYHRFSRPLQNTIGQKYALKLLGVLHHETVLADQRLDDADRARIERAVAAHRPWLDPA